VTLLRWHAITVCHRTEGLTLTIVADGIIEVLGPRAFSVAYARQRTDCGALST